MVAVFRYADDTVIYTTHRKTIKVIENTLSANMTVIKDWLEKNRLIINLKRGKTESMQKKAQRIIYYQANQNRENRFCGKPQENSFFFKDLAVTTNFPWEFVP